MSRSGKRSDGPDFVFDVPTTKEDNEALWKAHLDSMKISMETFLRLARQARPKRRDEEINSDSDEPFSLVD